MFVYFSIAGDRTAVDLAKNEELSIQADDQFTNFTIINRKRVTRKTCIGENCWIRQIDDSCPRDFVLVQKRRQRGYPSTWTSPNSLSLRWKAIFNCTEAEKPIRIEGQLLLHFHYLIVIRNSSNRSLSGFPFRNGQISAEKLVKCIWHSSYWRKDLPEVPTQSRCWKLAMLRSKSLTQTRPPIRKECSYTTRAHMTNTCQVLGLPPDLNPSFTKQAPPMLWMEPIFAAGEKPEMRTFIRVSQSHPQRNRRHDSAHLQVATMHDVQQKLMCKDCIIC